MANQKSIKVGIIGLGPVGMILAVKLKEAGCELFLCDGNAVKCTKIRTDGIVLENVFHASVKFDHVYSSISDMVDLDLDYLVFSLKSYQTADSLKQASLLNTEKLTVIAAQNGIDVENILAAEFGESKTLRMIVNYAGNSTSPNTVKVTFFTPPNYIGSINDQKAKQAEIFAEKLNSVGLTTLNVDSNEIFRRSWEKTILNASVSALCGVGRLTMAEAMNDPDTIELVEQIIKEGVDVAECEKIRFPDDFIRQCMRYLKKGGDHFPSLAVDIINNRQTEIDYFNGKIVEYGRKHYIRTSLNLAFTNMVKAMTNKNIISRIPGASGDLNKKIIAKGIVDKQKPLHIYLKQNCFLGIDLGSAYTKFTIISEEGNPIFRYTLPTHSKDRQALKNVIQAINASFNIAFSCATGYGRKHFTDTDIVKTEINCAAVGTSHYFAGEKNIVDIGGEDIKIIRCDADNHVGNFYMNDKCAAGTGAFLEEISERADINISEMSSLAANSNYDKELNSFCTVFAKTEIMNWIFDGMTQQDISKGIYISIANKVAKMRIDPSVPTYLVGGVVGFHPYLKTLLSERFNKIFELPESPQFVVSLGAALIAQQYWLHQPKEIEEIIEKPQLFQIV